MIRDETVLNDILLRCWYCWPDEYFVSVANEARTVFQGGHEQRVVDAFSADGAAAAAAKRPDDNFELDDRRAGASANQATAPGQQRRLRGQQQTRDREIRSPQRI